MLANTVGHRLDLEFVQVRQQVADLRHLLLEVLGGEVGDVVVIDGQRDAVDVDFRLRLISCGRRRFRGDFCRLRCGSGRLEADVDEQAGARLVDDWRRLAVERGQVHVDGLLGSSAGELIDQFLARGAGRTAAEDDVQHLLAGNVGFALGHGENLRWCGRRGGQWVTARAGGTACGGEAVFVADDLDEAGAAKLLGVGRTERPALGHFHGCHRPGPQCLQGRGAIGVALRQGLGHCHVPAMSQARDQGKPRRLHRS